MAAALMLYRPLAETFFCTQSEYFTTCNCVFNFNFLAVVVSGILGGSQICIRGPRTPPSGKILTPRVLAYTIMTVKFQLRSYINVRLISPGQTIYG